MTNDSNFSEIVNRVMVSIVAQMMKHRNLIGNFIIMVFLEIEKDGIDTVDEQVWNFGPL